MPRWTMCLKVDLSLPLSILHLFSRNSSLHPLHTNLKIVSKFHRNIVLAHPDKVNKRTLCLSYKATPKEFCRPLFLPLLLVRVDRKLLKWGNVRFEKIKGQLLSSELHARRHSCRYFFFAAGVVQCASPLINHGSNTRSLNTSFS